MKYNEIIQFTLLKDNRIVGVIHFTLWNGKALSPSNLSFGGFEFLEELPLSVLRNFVTWVIGEVHKKDIDEIRIVMPPSLYSKDSTGIVEWTLEECNFQHTKETGQAIECEGIPFYQKLTRFERSKLERCLQDSFQVKAGKGVLPKAAYNMIVKNRRLKNRPVSVNHNELVRNFDQFPKQFRWFGVWKNRLPAAAAIGIKVNSRIVYSFFPGHDVRFDKVSPMVLLINEMYQFCVDQKIKYLDLGISSENGVINNGLSQFKKNLGAKPYNQSRFRWTAS